jgi:hypothetical protein
MAMHIVVFRGLQGSWSAYVHHSARHHLTQLALVVLKYSIHLCGRPAWVRLLTSASQYHLLLIFGCLMYKPRIFLQSELFSFVLL